MKNFLVIIMLAILVGCSQNELLTDIDKSKQEDVTTTSLNSAIDLVVTTYGAVFTTTRAEQLKISSVEPFCPKVRSTRSSNSQLLFYIINFSDEKGFAIVLDDITHGQWTVAG